MVDFRFPRSCRVRLRGIPEVRAAAGEPDVDVGVGVGVVAGDAHDAGVVLLALRDSVEEGAEFEGNDLHAHAELLQIVLEKRGHFGAVGVGRAGEDAELNRFSVGILQRGLSVRSSSPGKASLFEKRAGTIERTRWAREIRIAPALVARSYQAPNGGAAALVDQANDGFAIGGGGNGLAKFHFAEPFLFALDFRRSFFAEVIQIEKKKIVFEAGASVGDRVAILLAREHRKVFGAQLADHVGFAGLELQDLRVGVGYKKKNQLGEVRQAIAVAVRFPVVRVAFKDQALALDIFLQAERSEARPLICGGAEGADLA